MLFSMPAWGADAFPDQVSAAATARYRPLQAGQKTWYSKINCHSCHHQFQPAMAFRVARAHGIPVDEEIAHADAVKAFAFTDFDNAVQYRDVQETAMDLGYSLVAADATGLEPNLVSAVYARLVAGRQDPAGAWDDLHQRPPQSYSSFTQTAIGLRAIQLYSHPSQKADVAARVAQARAWLLAHTPRDTEERTWQLIGLSWAAGRTRRFSTKPRKHWLRRSIRMAAGTPIEGRPSDAYSTAEVLVALHDAGHFRIADAAWQRGINYLVSTQARRWVVACRVAVAPTGAGESSVLRKRISLRPRSISVRFGREPRGLGAFGLRLALPGILLHLRGKRICPVWNHGRRRCCSARWRI